MSKIEEFPLRYQIPYEWGSVGVTEEAHKAYGLTPFVPTIEGPKALDVSKAILQDPRKVYLVSPTESKEFDEDALRGRRTRIGWRKKQTTQPIVYALPYTRDELVQVKIAQQDSQDDQTPSEALARLLADHRALLRIKPHEPGSFPQSYEQSASQTMAHHFANMVGFMMTRDVERDTLKMGTDKLVKHARNALIADLVIGGSPFVSTYVISGNVQPIAGIASAIILGMGALRQYKNVFEMPVEMTHILSAAKSISDLTGRLVAEEIHESFCSYTVNAKLGQDLDLS